MKSIQYPNKNTWENLCKRPVFKQEDLEKKIFEILKNVKLNGDKALFQYSKTYDNVELDSLIVNENEIAESNSLVSEELKAAINVAKTNIDKFHNAQNKTEEVVETTKGVKCWRKNVAIEKVGLYIPGGSAPLFSTVLMLAIPAKIAGCKEIILCTPPNKENKINPVILYTAQLLEVAKIFKIGGAQAIAALSYGTESVPKVYKIFGPGNQFVTKAKELVQRDGIAIDMPAGPSEVLVIADRNSNPEFIAADLLSQAEHGADSQVVLLTDDKLIIEKIFNEVNKQLELLPRKEIAIKSLENSFAVVLNNIDECIEFSNVYAPEHLIISVDNANDYINEVINAGSVFIGKYSCESAGDYASGTNHTLPTNGFARNYSGVSVDSFVKKITFQELTEEGIKEIGKSIELMAEAEQLFAHKNAVSLRFKNIK